MCGVIGLISTLNIPDNPIKIYEGLTFLQHRGQDSTGICNETQCIKKDGLVKNAFSNEDLLSLTSNICMGHVRYGTNGNFSSNTIQPLEKVIMEYTRVHLCHNGHIINADEIEVNQSDSEVVLNLFCHLLEKKAPNEIDINVDNIFEVIHDMMKMLKGSYSIIMTIQNFGLICFRDPRGIRPLCYGIKDNDYLVSSESVAIDALDFQMIRDVNPGEIIIFEHNSKPRFSAALPNKTPCLFEYIYFARIDSVIDGISVYDARYRMGQLLANKIKSSLPHISDIDLIVPVPESGLIFALGLQSILQIPMHYGLVKNPYIERTFIMKNDEIIQKSIKRKLNFVREVIQDKNILIVDDSIVRGNTSSHIIQMAKKAGAKNIYFASGSPPIINTNHYGIYIPTREQLVAVNRNEQEIADVLGATKVIYNDMDAIVNMLKQINPQIKGFESSIWGIASPMDHNPCS